MSCYHPCFSGVASSSWFARDTESLASQANPGQLVTLHFRDEDAESQRDLLPSPTFLTNSNPSLSSVWNQLVDSQGRLEHWRKRKWGCPGLSGEGSDTPQPVALGTIASGMRSSGKVLRGGWDELKSCRWQGLELV